ncbi:MAG: tetratricopeptide repeat-containing protein [Candidatus Melainabacteria bacterium]|nr:tetratricopeptide repeat-containing protein [Candidatus Melainabacteria bacterium]
MTLLTKFFLTFSALVAMSFGVAGEAFAGPAEWEKHTQTGADAFRENRFGEAERAFQASITEAKAFGEHDMRLATSLTNLGVLYNSRGQFDKAEPLFERAVTIKQKALGPFNVEVADSAARLCQFYMKRKKYEKADPICHKITQYGEMQIRDLTNMDNSYKHLQNYYSHHKELEQAKALVLQAQQITHDKAIESSLELAVLLDQIADAYMTRRNGHDKPESEALYKEALRLRERTLSGNHLALAQSYGNLGKLYVEENRHALAEPLLQKAFSISKETVGMAKPQTYQNLDAYAHSLAALGRQSKAEDLYRQAKDAFASAYGKGSNTLADINLSLANLLEHRGQYQEAASLVGEALKIREHANGPSSASVTSVKEKYAYLRSKSSGKKEAMKLQTKADQL